MEIFTLIGHSLAQTAGLPANVRSRLLGFLRRWEHHDATLACLDILQQSRPDLVSLYDARAQVLLACDQPARALDIIQQRHQRKRSLNSQILEARIHMALGDLDVALTIARDLLADKPENLYAWQLLGDVHLARGDPDAAEGAYRHIDEIHPGTRMHAYSLAKLYHARGDAVSAIAWATRMEALATVEAPLSVSQLRWLQQFYQEHRETTRAEAIQEQLQQRYQTEISELRAILAGQPTARPTRRTRDRHKPPARSEGDTVQPLPSLQVKVSPTENQRLVQAAHQFFQFESLRPGQAEVMALMLRGENVLAIMPTGAGKSLCYQLPALLNHGTTLVISPLIALMKDQVESLPAALRPYATTINSTLDGDELRHRLYQVARGQYRLVYAAPERLRQLPFIHALREAGITRFVIDEAHCVSLWGHDFRPDYLFMAEARHMLGDPPLLAMTATAPPRVQQDIARRLGEFKVVATDIYRANLQLEVIHVPNEDSRLRHLIALCQKLEGAGIVYATTRAKCEELARVLCNQGVAAGYYHAGVSNRTAAQDAFMQGQWRIVVATVAFGMGIDKGDIRFIVHYNLPRSLEAYYQEAGRAGRDGQRSRCILFYASSDRSRLTRWARQDQLSVSFLREVYRSVTRRLGPTSVNRIPLDDLMRDVRAEDTSVRVALSLLEEAGLLRRHFDIPRSTTLTWLITAGTDPAFAAFTTAARLVPGQPVVRDLTVLAQDTGHAPTELEQQLLQWQQAGWIEYHPVARDLLLERLPPPEDAPQRVERLLSTYAAIQTQRIDDIARYAKTRECRHHYISTYFGGRRIEHCGACDNCLDI